MSVFPEFDNETHVVTVRKIPEWATSSDVITKRGKRYFLLSYQTESRWRQCLRRLGTWLRRWIDEH